MEKTIADLKNMATQLRRDVLRMVHGAKSGHPGGSLGSADLMTVLFFRVLNHTPYPYDKDGFNQDLFILSNGHICPVLYAALARSNYFPVEELSTFRKLDSRLQGHPATHDLLPGIRIATGSLGQGLSVAIGAALSKKLNNDSGLVYCLCGDGEIQEGQVWEALMFAAHNKSKNLILLIDYNQKQIDGDIIDIIGLDNLKSRFSSFNWEVDEIDGNNMEDLVSCLEKNKENVKRLNKPLVIILKTTMGMGVDFMMGTHKWHGVAPNDQQLNNALIQLKSIGSDY